MNQSQQRPRKRPKGQSSGVNAVPGMTLRLREEERAAVARLCISSGKGVTDVVRDAILESDKRASEEVIGSQIDELRRVLTVEVTAIQELAKRLEDLFRMFRAGEEKAKVHDAAVDLKLAVLEQSLMLVVGGVTALGFGYPTKGEKDYWLQTMQAAMASHEKGVLGRQLLEAAAKIQKGA